MRRDPLARVDQFLLRRVAAEAEPDRRARRTIVEAERAEDVAWPARAAGAGAAERKGDVAQIGDQSCPVEAFAADVEVSVIAVLGTSVDDPTGPKRGNRGGPKFLHMIIIARAALLGELGRGAETDAQHRRQGPRSKPLLLAAAVEQGRRRATLAHPQGAQLIASVALPVKATLPPLSPSACSTCLRATSIAASASLPQRDGECGLANFSSIHGCMALATSGAGGVVA